MESEPESALVAAEHDSAPPPARHAPSARAKAMALILSLFATGVGLAPWALIGGFYLFNWISPLPDHALVPPPRSPVVTDRDGAALLTRLTSDGQWRLPARLDQVSPWMIQATLAVEDERFRGHHGVDPVAVARAAWQNATSGRVVSGASTITMQVCRMAGAGRGASGRTLGYKLNQAFRAVQMERVWDKDQILTAYFNAAPYGANISGVGAASALWFAKPPEKLSLGEAALLAGLPQSPTRFNPTLRPEDVRRRREIVLRRMTRLGMITQDQAKVAAAEPLPEKIHAPEIAAPHAAWLALRRRPEGGQTTLDMKIQRELERVVASHKSRLPIGSEIAVVAIQVATGDIVGMVGSADPGDPRDGMNNGATARRSPGSALKPFIYAAAFETGRIGPDSPIDDRPIRRAGWAPNNFRLDFSGRLSAADALRRSLNIPAILLTEALGLSRVTATLEKSGVFLPRSGANRAGLAIAVGATEVRLLDLTNGYATLAREGRHRRAKLFIDESNPAKAAIKPEVCAAIDEILSIRRRSPRSMTTAEQASAHWAMWKTGTSAGRRDAWALGHNHDYALGVWVGAFSGGSRNEFVGEEAAEPILLDLLAREGSPLVKAKTRPGAIGSDAAPAHQPLPVAPYPLLARRSAPQPAPRIIFPETKGRYLTDTASLRFRPQTTFEGAGEGSGLFWFLDGKRVKLDQDREMEVSMGPHELRVMDAKGRAHAVQFEVRTFPAKTYSQALVEVP